MARHSAVFGLLFLSGCVGFASFAYGEDLKIKFSLKYRDQAGAVPLGDAPVRIVSNFAHELVCDQSSADDGSVECTIKACGSSADTQRRMHRIVFEAKASREPNPSFVRVIVRHRDGKCALEPSDADASVFNIEYLDRVRVASSAQEDIVRLFGERPNLASLRTDGVRQQVFIDGAVIAASWLKEPGGVERFSAVRTVIQDRAAEAAKRDPSSEQAVLFKAQLETLGVAALIGATNPSDTVLSQRLLNVARERGFAGAAASFPLEKFESTNNEAPGSVVVGPGVVFYDVIQRGRQGQLGWTEFKGLEDINRFRHFQATVPRTPPG